MDSNTLHCGNARPRSRGVVQFCPLNRVQRTDPLLPGLLHILASTSSHLLYSLHLLLANLNWILDLNKCQNWVNHLAAERLKRNQKSIREKIAPGTRRYAQDDFMGHLFVPCEIHIKATTAAPPMDETLICTIGKLINCTVANPPPLH